MVFLFLLSFLFLELMILVGEALVMGELLASFLRIKLLLIFLTPFPDFIQKRPRSLFVNMLEQGGIKRAAVLILTFGN